MTCRKLLVVAALAWAADAQATGIGEGPIGLACPNAFEISSGLSAAPSGRAGVTTAGTAGQLRCIRFTSPCTGTMTKLAFQITGGVGSSQAQVSIYSSDGTSRIANGDIEATTSPGVFDTASLTIPLVYGRQYLACIATSETVTLAYSGSQLTDPVAGAMTGDGMFFSGGTLAQFNGTCTAGSTPNACCSGADAGTCTGNPTSTGTLTAVTGSITAGGIPLVWLGR